ncbi:hypothetical protein [Salipaludibacillus sp. CUR1]|nr:hypothetical protein [Salipaludibacillus sp. CUR1]
MEISRINGINENTIKTRLKRARKMIKKALEKEEST